MRALVQSCPMSTKKMLSIRGVLILAMTGVTSMFAETPAEERAQRAWHFYRHDCAPCHGQEGLGNDRLRAPAIAGLPDFYVVQQMHKFRQQLRALDPTDEKQRSMHQDAAELDDDTFQMLGEFIAGLPARRQIASVIGDAERGDRLFARMCAECHGSDAEGNPAKESPPLHGFQDWYIVDQVKRFKAGKRKADPANVDSVSMHFMAKRLWLERDVRDIAAFVTTRLEGEPDAEP